MTEHEIININDFQIVLNKIKNQKQLWLKLI